MPISLINPANQAPLRMDDGVLADAHGNAFPVIRGVPRFCEVANYTDSFGKQWNLFRGTQIVELGQAQSKTRFFETTAWTPDDLAGLDILEVGSGAGRFSRVVLEHSAANLWSVDYSSAVEANLANNGSIDPGRFHVFQASIYEMPFPDCTFEKVFCMGVLQHTPDFEASVRALIGKAKHGGEIVVDFYPIKGFWTKLHAKYLLRPLTRRMPHDRLLHLIDRNVDWMMGVNRFLGRCGLGFLKRFIPLVDMDTVVPAGLEAGQRREWAVLDTFDMFSPHYDQPRRIRDVADMFRRAGAKVTFADLIQIGSSTSAVVRAVKM